VSKTALVITLRRLDPTAATAEADIAAIDVLLQAAYNAPSWRFRVERGLALQPDGWVVACAGTSDAIVGCGGFLAFTESGFGWIGLVATHPEYQRQGVARRVTQYLVDRLRERGCAAALDGSASGAPLYASMGFVDHGVATLLTIDDPAGAAAALAARTPTNPAGPISVQAAGVADLDAIDHFDQRCFGGPRRELLRRLLVEFPDRAALAVDAAGAIRGYVVAQADAIGPLVVTGDGDAGDARDALLEWSLCCPWRSAPRIIVPPDSDHLDAVRGAGFEQQRALRHQRLGIDDLPGARAEVVAQVSFGEG
jgi:GNAT superfamily N-acetyltransferase